MTEFIVDKKGGKLSVVLAAKYPQIGYGTLRKLLRKGDIRINGVKVFSDGYVNVGDTVRLYYDVSVPQPKIIYEDRLIAVFFKPKKIRTVGDNSFEEIVQSYFPGYLACHRLDTNTDGLVVFAKSQEVFDALKKAFRTHKIEKRYLAFVYGVVDGETTAIAYLKKDERLGIVKISDGKKPGYAKIETHFSPIRVYSDATALDVEIVTGKTHQIRAHLAHLGHPIIGDSKYGENIVNRAYGKSMQMLTAYKLVFHTDDGMLSALNGVEVKIDIDYLLNGFSERLVKR